ncbi:MAG: universal stress protein [Synechococcaceae cyanobacterium]|nr:universal stress protein [Synechococcaceae cyanobacterium]
MFDTVLFPIDQSRQTLETAAVALQLAQQHGSRMVLLSVIEPEDSGAMHDPEAVARLLEQARDRFAQAGVEAQVIEREGKPAFVIGDVADEVNADLIVMGTRGITLEEDQHSTAARVIQLAPCPVLVVP